MEKSIDRKPEQEVKLSEDSQVVGDWDKAMQADVVREYQKMICAERHVANSDNAYLEPLRAGPGAIGCVNEVNGEGAREMPGFVPTKHELMQIIKYWHDRLLHENFWLFGTGQTGSTEFRIASYSSRRIARIANLLPEHEFNLAIEKVEQDFKQRKKISDDDWNIFKYGTSDQWSAYQEENWRKFESENSETPETP